MERVKWIEAANRVVAGERTGLRCPQNDDDVLDVEWSAGPAGAAGEFHLRCPSCGAETWVRADPDRDTSMDAADDRT